jgi:hypothetical protein
MAAVWKKYKALDVISKSLGLNLIFARRMLCGRYTAEIKKLFSIRNGT